MKTAIRRIVFADLGFLALLLLSGLFDGVGGDVIYYSAAVIPFALTLIVSKRELGGGWMLIPDKKRSILCLSTLFPTILAVIALSLLTSLILTSLGIQNAQKIEGTLPEAIIKYALIPAVSEELLFRYLPLLIGKRIPKRTLIILTSVLFALVHADLFAIPYAFVAGAVFMTVDLICHSPIPSLIMHFLNNLSSLLYTFFGENEIFEICYFSVILAASAASLAAALIWRREYRSLLLDVWDEERVSLSCFTEVLLVAIPALAIAILSIIR